MVLCPRNISDVNDMASVLHVVAFLSSFKDLEYRNRFQTSLVAWVLNVRPNLFLFKKPIYLLKQFKINFFNAIFILCNYLLNSLNYCYIIFNFFLWDFGQYRTGRFCYNYAN